MTGEVTEKQAHDIYAKMKPFVHYVWVDRDGFAWERDKDASAIPDGMTLELRWLPYALEWDFEKEEYKKYAIIDPPTFEEFCRYVKWKLI